ncbi:MAG: hypothetical protein KI790_06520 [Cyclobacteriaceae bacterium]|nr:hypothetical protein [Cyclobacteriaceae bacterium HetDA_MAG_MS6]
MKKLFIPAFTLLLAFSALSQDRPRYSCGDEAVAFDGNDLVSYYENTSVQAGSESYKLEHDGLTLLFTTNANREKFKANPDKYLPAYGGWCAIALASGTLARPDFNHYKVQDGKLLFFEVKAFFNGKTAWEKDPDINKIVADKKYNEIFGN